MLLHVAPTLHFLEGHQASVSQFLVTNQVYLSQIGLMTATVDFAASRKARRALVWKADFMAVTREVEVALIGAWEPVFDGAPLSTVQLEVNLSQMPKHVRGAQAMRASYEHRLGGLPAAHVSYRNVLHILGNLVYNFLASGEPPQRVDFNAPVFAY